jgi:hypothetical protein
MHSIDEFLAKKICKKEISSGSTEWKKFYCKTFIKFIFLTSSFTNANHFIFDLFSLERERERKKELFSILERDIIKSKVLISQVYNSLNDWTLLLLQQSLLLVVCQGSLSLFHFLFMLFMFRMHNQSLSPCFHTIDICDHALSFFFKHARVNFCILIYIFA